jgi:DNA polymerase I-like protein with 3'-5' exonuclease and polymerase domains
MSHYSTDSATGLREKVKSYVLQTETGRKFLFKEYYSDSSWSTKTYNFSPTEMKNYPIQGLATGDIVPMMLGIIFRKLIMNSGVCIVNTIHDSIMFDVHPMQLDYFLEEIKETLKNTHKYFESIFGTPLALKLNAGASVGDDWFNMKELT